ncbi:MAG TPA: glycosyltransferase, partial [Ktedonobacterales bacterium]
GCAVVASDIPGYRTVIEDAINGLLVKPRDPEHIAWAITYVLLDPERRRHLAEAARVRAQEYAWDRVAREIESYYLEVIAAPRSTRRPPMRQISGGIAAHVGE